MSKPLPGSRPKRFSVEREKSPFGTISIKLNAAHRDATKTAKAISKLKQVRAEDLSFQESISNFRAIFEGSLGQKRTERKARGVAKQAQRDAEATFMHHAAIDDKPKPNPDYHSQDDPGSHMKALAARAGRIAAASVLKKGERGGEESPSSPLKRAGERFDALTRHYKNKAPYPFDYVNRMLDHRKRQGQAPDPFHTSERKKVSETYDPAFRDYSQSAHLSPKVKPGLRRDRLKTLRSGRKVAQVRKDLPKQSNQDVPSPLPGYIKSAEVASKFRGQVHDAAVKRLKDFRKG